MSLEDSGHWKLNTTYTSVFLPIRQFSKQLCVKIWQAPPVRLKELLGPKAENELEWKFGLLAGSMGLHSPELDGSRFRSSQDTAVFFTSIGRINVSVFSCYLSELSLSTDVMCARPFPWLSLFPGPEPPDMESKSFVSSYSSPPCLDVNVTLAHCYTFTWTLVITCSYSSKGGSSVFAWEWSGCRQFISRGLFQVSLTEK